jgi:hypothetical protein
MSSMQHPKRLLSLAGLLVFALAGCGPNLGSVEGTVTLDGKPVKGVEVTFQPVGEEGGTAIGYTDAQGHYNLHYPGHEEGAPPGEYNVRLAGGEGGSIDGAPPVRIPAKYNSQSDLKRTVQPGANTFDFPLESK